MILLNNILVTFLATSYVVQGNMTLGTLLSVSYIIGQMNSPVNQLVNFFRSLQDARLSLERLNEVQNHPKEESNIINKLENSSELKSIDINEDLSKKMVLKRGLDFKN